jgi:hypothetical protein
MEISKINLLEKAMSSANYLKERLHGKTEKVGKLQNDETHVVNNVL